MFKQIVLLLIGGIIAYVGQLVFNNYQTETKAIDYKVTIDKNFISTPNIPEHKIKILIDDKEQKEITKVQVDIFNFSNKDFNKVPVFIILKSNNKEKINIVGTYEEGFKSIPSSVTKILDKKLLPKNNQNAYGYNITTLKRTENYESGLKVVYLLQGKVKPEIEIFTSLNGVTIIPFDYTHSPKSMTQNILAITILIGTLIILLLIMFFALFPFISRFTHPLDRKPRIKYADELTEELAKISLLNPLALPKDKLSEIIKEILYQQKKKKWDEKSKVLKWIDGFVEPKLDDYKE